MDAQLLYAFINFVIFTSLLGFFLRKPAREFWGNRAEGLRTRIEQARQHRAKAESEYERLAARVDQLGQEMAALKERMSADGALEKKKILEEAEAAALRLTEASKRIGEQEWTKARFRLRSAATQTTVGMAEKQIVQQITDDDQKRLATDYLDRLAAENLQILDGGLA